VIYFARACHVQPMPPHPTRVPLFPGVPLAAPAVFGALAGCTHVRPHERGALARPTMTAAVLTGAGEEHLHSAHEGATGGGGGGGGCN